MSRTLCLLALTLSFPSAIRTAFADDPPVATTATTTVDADRPSVRITPRADAAFRAGLEKRIDIDFDAKPLSEAIAHIAKASGLPIVINEFALEEEGIPLDERVTLRGKQTRVAAILPRMLEPLGLTWIPKGEVVEVTSVVDAEDNGGLEILLYDMTRFEAAVARSPGDAPVLLSDRTYPRPPRVPRSKRNFFGLEFNPQRFGTGGGQFRVVDDMQLAFQFGPHPYRGDPAPLPVTSRDDERSLVESLVTNFNGAPEWWSDDGGPGSVTRIGHVYAVRQRRRIQDDVEQLLEALTRMATTAPVQPTLRPFDHPTVDVQRIRRALETKISVDFRDKPLDEALAVLADRMNIDIVVDDIALEEEGIPLDEPITLTLENVTLRTVLVHMLEKLGLTWFVKDDALRITSVIISEGFGNLVVALVDARDIAESTGDTSEITSAIVELTGTRWSWEVDGGLGCVRSILGGVLVIRQTEPVLDEIESLLATLRTGLAGRPPKGLPRFDDVRTLDYTLTEHDPAEIADLVETFVDPASWQGEQGGAISVVGRQLFIRTTLANHTRVHELLSQLKPLHADEPATSVPKNSGDGP